MGRNFCQCEAKDSISLSCEIFVQIEMADSPSPHQAWCMDKQWHSIVRYEFAAICLRPFTRYFGKLQTGQKLMLESDSFFSVWDCDCKRRLSWEYLPKSGRFNQVRNVEFIHLSYREWGMWSVGCCVSATSQKLKYMLGGFNIDVILQQRRLMWRCRKDFRHEWQKGFIPLPQQPTLARITCIH